MLFRPQNLAGLGTGTSNSTIFVGAVGGPSAGAETLSWPAGSQAGDYGFIFFPYSSSVTSPTGWTISYLSWINYGYVSVFAHKVLSSGDISGTSINTTFARAAAVYRGPTAATLKSTNRGGTGTALSLPGLTKDVASKGIVSFVTDRDGAGVYASAPGFTSRLNATGTYFTLQVADMLNVANYTNGATIDWTGFQNGTDQVGVAFDLT